MGKRIQPLSILLFGLDLVLIVIALYVATELRSIIPLGRGGALAEAVVEVPGFVYVLALVCYSIGLVASGAYNPQASLRWFMEALRIVWGTVLATILMAGVLYMSYRELSRLQFVYFFFTTNAFMLSSRAILRLFYRVSDRDRPGGRSRILVLGAGALGERVAKALLDHSRWGYYPVGFLDDDPEKQNDSILSLPVLGGIDELRAVVERRQVNEVWVALPATAMNRLGEVVEQLETLPVRIKVVPDYFSFALIQTKSEILGNLPVIGLRDPLIEGVPRLIKRGFDLIVTLLLLPLALPLMGLIGLAILIDSGRPVLFRQERVGENGRIFDMFKFRTMRPGVEAKPKAQAQENEAGQLVHKRPDDPRVTPVGRWLRRYSLDELPQLLNVLKGDMSLVGPRPEMPWLVDRYESWQRKRFAVPQGLTGWWQINGRSDRPMHLHTEDDLYYVYNYSLWLDIKILLQTPFAVLRGKGAF